MMAEYPTIKLDKLKPHPKNPRNHTDEQIEKIARSIKELGWGRPIIISTDYYILAGHGAWEAAEGLGCEEVPYRMMQHQHDAPEALAYMVADNKLTDESTWNYSDLELVFEDIRLESFDVTLTGFNPLEVDEVKEKIHGPTEIVEDEFDPDSVTTTTIQPGQIWQLGSHRLMCGDSTNKEDVELLTKDNTIDLFFTDPPYGVSYADKNAFLNAISRGNRIQTPISNDHKELAEMKEIWLKSFHNALNVSRKGASYYICSPQGGELMMMMMMMMIMEAGWELKHTIIWVKNNHVLGRSDYNYKHEPLIYGWKEGGHKFYGEPGSTTVWEIPKPHKSDLHPTMKPIELCAKAIQNSSLKEENVLDLFGGSGSTLIACEQLQRHCYMMELDPHYCDVIINRWETFTDQKAEQIS